MPSYVFDNEQMKLVPKDEYYAKKYIEGSDKRSDLPFPNIMSDIEEFQMVAVKGKPWVTSRSQRDALEKQHGLVCVGNEPIKAASTLDYEPSKEEIKGQLAKAYSERNLTTRTELPKAKKKKAKANG